MRVHTDTSIANERPALGGGVDKNFPAQNSENVGISASDEVRDSRGRIERWEQERVGAEEVIFQRVAEGETLKQICKSRRWPYSVVARWVGETPEVMKAYEFALRLWADSLAVETVDLADGTDPTEVGLGKLKTDVRMKLASRLDRARYGDKVEVSGTVNHAHSLIGILSGMQAADTHAIDVTPVEALPDATVEEDPI